ncbi:hypothetical protein B0T10DRAFT_604285 [Thelonectria olida]|uniref:Uncharacterized protein n=1 Tax=Thelonectria olida TaxID=1576542 RepID=A0A9P8W902_9HYPO|nr:hypothetical protein B0T10DRAFT_604285 [Thelonectria olida]
MASLLSLGYAEYESLPINSMDPFSLSASIAGLIALADITFKYVYKYVRAAKGAENDIQALSDEINGLATLLRVLGALATDLEAEGDRFDPALRTHYLSHCNKTLARIETRVKKAADSLTRSKFEGFSRQLKWPFSMSETKDLLAELSRHKATIGVALATDSMRKLQLSLSKTSELEKQVSAITRTVKQIEINTLIEVNSQKQRILDYFMKASPQSNLETSIRLRHAMTGLWLTESPRLIQFLETPGSKLWLTGIPGAGKTVLAGSVIQEALVRSHAAPETSVAFFFCDYKSPATWETSTILGAVASQLARQKDEAFEILRQYHDDLHPERGLAQAPDSEELRARISQMSKLFGQTIIVIDGLDECGDNEGDVVDMLLEVAEFSEGVSMALFSRDHFNIRIRLEQDFSIVPIAAHTEDIQLYVGAELEKRIQSRRLLLSDMNMKDEIMDALVGRAEGMFRWVVCQLDYLCDCAHDGERREALRQLPPDLPESYRRLLERVNRFSPRVQAMVQMCLSFIEFTSPRLTILELRQAVSTPDTLGATLDKSNTISEQEIARRCSSFIRKSEDGLYFEFAHFSVREFLGNEVIQSARGPESYISQERSRSLLACQCLRFLQLRNFQRQPTVSEKELSFAEERHEVYPFYHYSAIQWIDLTREGLNDLTLPLATTLFHPRKKAQFLLWAIQILRSVATTMDKADDHDDGWKDPAHRRVCQRVLDASFKPLHMAAALNLPEICGFLLGQGEKVDCRWGNVRPIDLAFTSVLEMPEISTLSKSVDHIHPMSHLLPQSIRRNLSIDCLISSGARPSNRVLSPDSLSPLSVVSILGAWLGDFTPLLKLLSCNIVPTELEVKFLGDCMDWRMGKVFEKTDATESSTLAILQHLASTSAFTSDWGRQMGSIIWHYALKRNFSYTNDPFLVDSRISISEDALVVQTQAAISIDNTESVKQCLADGRLDQNAPYSEDGNTFLHLAVQKASYKVLEVLLVAGCNPGLENADGNLPIHMHDWSNDFQHFEIMKGFGVSLSSPNAQGYTIWHCWAHHASIFDEFPAGLFELDGEAASKALQMRTPTGHTPLSILLKTRPLKPKFDMNDVLERRALLLLETCSTIPGFWENHDPVFGAAAQFGSEMIIRRLQEAGARFEVAVEGACTPLHQVGAAMPLGGVQFLLAMYQDALTWRFQDELPMEAYIKACLRDGFAPAMDVTEVLIPPVSNRETLWTFVCNLLGHTQQRPDHGWSVLAYKQWISMTEDVTATILGLGAMEIYEERTHNSGVTALLSGLNGAVSWLQPLTFYLTPDTLRDALSRTKHWATARESFEVFKFFISAVMNRNLDMFRLLLEHGVDVHSRRNRAFSLVEDVFRAEKVHYPCSSPVGRVILQELLDYCTEQGLKEFQPTNEGRGLLHGLATSKDVTHVLWLVEALVKRGVDVNGVTQDNRGFSVLTYHLYKASSQYAQLLLELGADPLIGGHSDSPTALQAATATGNVAFLEKLLAHTTKASSDMKWEIPMTVSFTLGGSTVALRKANALHQAAIGNFTDCLKFFLDNRLISIDTSKSLEGWTPLHLSAFRADVKSMKLLTSKGFDVMAENQFGETPLHIAVRGKSLSAVKLLLKNGATQSLNFKGESPMQYARNRDLAEIALYLHENCKDEKKLSQAVRRRILSKEQLNIFAESLTRAARNDDQSECEGLLIAGCPVDIPLPGTGACTALVLALQLESLGVAKWLLSKGASVLKSNGETGESEPDDINSHLGAIEIAASAPILNPLLPQLVTSYCSQGGDLVFGDDFPCHHAVWNGNVDGLELLIQSMEACGPALECKYQMPLSRIIEVVVNRRSHDPRLPSYIHQSLSDIHQVTPLHTASSTGNISAASLLVEKGALINATDPHSRTPLIWAETADMAEHLVSSGASTGVIYRTGLLRLLGWLPAGVFEEIYPILFSRMPNNSLINSVAWGYPTPVEYTQLTPEIITTLNESSHSFIVEDGGGCSLMHRIICEDDLSDVVLNGEYGLLETTPFPWHLQWEMMRSIAFLTSRFCHFRRHLPHDIFQKILNLEPPRAGSWSPLCLAAALDLVGIMANCLEMGARIDFEGCPAGSAVMVASVCGSFDAVKFLVRNGASVAYESSVGQHGTRSCFSLAESQEIKSWLLAGRFMDQRRIAAPRGNQGTEEVQTQPWSGIGRSGVRLYGKREKDPMGSTLDNAKRLGKAKKYWEGKVLPIDDEIASLLDEEN